MQSLGEYGANHSLMSLPLKHMLIADQIRKRICLVPPEQGLLLREGELGEEFSMSRTPMRQILQAIERDNLIEIRAGLGSTVPALRAEDRVRSLHLVRDMYWAASRFSAGQAIDDQTVAGLAKYAAEARKMEQLSAEAYVDLTIGFIDTVLRQIDERILITSLRAVSWRGFRWRVEDVLLNRSATLVTVRASLDQCLEASKTGDVSSVLLAVAAIASELADPAALC